MRLTTNAALTQLYVSESESINSGRGGGGTPRASSFAPGVPPRRGTAEELVNLMLEAARRGEWRVVSQMLDRVGKPTEHVVTEERVDVLRAELLQIPQPERRAIAAAPQRPRARGEGGSKNSSPRARTVRSPYLRGADAPTPGSCRFGG